MVLGLVLQEAQAAPAVTFENAWIRALPPTQKVTAAYLSITNGGNAPVLVTGVSSPLAGRGEIHRSREVDGYVRMERLPELELAPGVTLDLRPGGTHIMLLDMSRMPSPGDTSELCLTLEPGGETCIEAAVRKSAQEGGMDHHGHH